MYGSKARVAEALPEADKREEPECFDSGELCVCLGSGRHQDECRQSKEEPEDLCGRHLFVPQIDAEEDGDDDGDTEGAEDRADGCNGQGEVHQEHRADEEDAGDESGADRRVREGPLIGEDEISSDTEGDGQVVGCDDDRGVVTATFAKFEELDEAEVEDDGKEKISQRITTKALRHQET